MKPDDDLIALAREVFGLGVSVAVELSPLEGRGSDRTYTRLRWNHGGTAILVRYEPARVENTYFADIAVFLRGIHLPVPRVMHHDPDHGILIMEDLGNTDLWFFREETWEIRRPLYQKTLTVVHRLHSVPEKDFPSGRVRLMEGFGPELYRWEQDYFKAHFVRDVCGIEMESSLERGLDSELSLLAERLSASARSLVHRDLQSKNVMIRGGEPFLIDFQGMRFGSPFYDLGSLLCDPYVVFPGEEQEQLLSFYYGLSKWNLDWNAFQAMFRMASVQRLMQALGAYGFLGLRKGLPAFLSHIPAGLHALRRATADVPSLRHLRELSHLCRPVIPEANKTEA
jgi:aminoglycoside/choline kinase family phosphotransferase